MKVKKLIYNENSERVSWSHKNQTIRLEFKKPVFQAVFSKFLQIVIVIADYREVGPNNLFIYNMDGSIKINPEMPKTDFIIEGVYALWYIDVEVEQTLVLISNQNENYETKCKYNLKSNEFSNFNLTK